ncbi:MAG: DUF6128 domain-containing protein [Vallitalea sp.]|nr:DUF6128 domain-containing protein [Vallitalea sp.]
MNFNKYNRKVIDFIEEDRGFTTQNKNTYGYCKIETRGEKCRIKCCINGLKKLNDQSYEVNLVNINDNVNLVPIGNLIFDNNNLGSLNISTDVNNVVNTKYSLDDFSIIVIHQKTSETQYVIPLAAYLQQVDTSWKKNISINKNNVEPSYQKQNHEYINEKESHKEIIEEAQPEEKTVDDNKDTVINNKEKISNKDIVENEKDIKVDIEVKDKTNKNIINENKVIDDKVNKPIEINDIGNQTFDIMKNHFDNEELRRIHNNLFNNYPNINPFECKQEDKQWIRIEPADIIYFPLDSWMLTNNTFLLNAYQKYKHLILGRDKNSFPNQSFLILGVPGIYYPKNKVAAHFYGFNDFECCSKAKTKVGEYGYWIKSIECLNN